ncbi:TrmH family RNA methyltransferase [Salegentibacter chungangensis]|uniref:TrmH family RNA methyltransferase n=1 Tax=Salegentibacter chungangensis TaxID=1335724 RepID=A0ABW3NQ54_9FLAO
MKKQLSHHESKFETRKLPITLIVDNVTGEANLGSLFRLADAFNIEKIVFCGYEPNLKSNRLKRTARNTHEYVEFEYHEDSLDAVKSFKDSGYLIYSLEITKNSIPVEDFEYEPGSKLALVIGNESFGIEEDILENSHKTLHINMYGNNSSMNVAQATGIALYEISKSILAFNKK